MSSCATHRLAEIAVALAVILLLALLVILTTGSSFVVTKERSARANGTVKGEQPIFERELLRTNTGDADDGPLDIRSTEFSSQSILPDEDLPWSHWKSDIMPTGGGDSESIVLAKANQNSYEDPLDENSKMERHHSGHFRHSQNKVWDPHPQYEFVAFGRKFHLSLREENSFTTPGVSVTHISDNVTRREFPDNHLGCYYTGHVNGDPKSIVSVSLCHGMTGHMRTSSGNYAIKPTERWNDSDKSFTVGSPLKHVIYRMTKSDFMSVTNRTANDLPDDDNTLVNDTHECGVIDMSADNTNKENDTVIDDASDNVKVYIDEQPVQGRRRRRRVSYPQNDERDNSYDGRSFAVERNDRDVNLDIYGSWRTRRALPREYFVEIMVVADAKMKDYHGASLTSYILVLMNTVSRIYKDPSIGNPISIVVIKIQQIDEVFGERQRGSDGIGASEMLRKFCHWQKLNNPHEPSSEHHDAALLLTRENLCHNPGLKRCDTLGLAELGRMCSPGSSCAIVQDNGLATAFTIAHEIGHVLNMPHDDDPKCTRFRDGSGVHNIMSRMLDDNTVPWEWSKCSRHYVTEFLDAGQGNCLLDEPPRDNTAIMSRSHSSRRLPGEDYSENRQCELVYGAGSEICPHMVSDVCKRLWCTIPYWDDRSEQCHTQHMPWADGTVCGPGKWCHRGECVSRENLVPVDGQWGPWTIYGECSRTCGGGIQKRHRECDSPAPKNGGNYCVGDRVRYRSCNTHECPPASVDFREEQCSAFDNDNRNIRNLAKNVKWKPKYSRIAKEERCKLYCQVAGNQYYALRDKVIDGTPCELNSFHVCVNGHCQPAGCDHTLDSPATLDACGVCRGDNSTCQRITGSYNNSEYGYSSVIKIPAGSSYIDIRQYGWKGSHNDSNYLALRLAESGKYILNGNFMVMHRKQIKQPGVTIDYSGSDHVVERLNSSTPIQVDLILEVLSVGNIYPPQIIYEYTVPKRILERFMWTLSDWTPCDRMCQGLTYRKALCRSSESKDMSDDYCPMEKKPREESQTCNTHCELQWQEIPNTKSECSSHCGPGTTIVKHRCVMMPLSHPGSIPISPTPRPVPSYLCHYLERPQERKPCEGPCEYAHWQYSDWSTCSATCGDNGIQQRTATCVDVENRTVPESMCPKDEKIVRQACGHKACPKWGFGDWGPCSVKCGVGKRERPYWCRIGNQVVHPNHCKGQIVASETCDSGPCPTWHTGDWSPCSTTCGNGIRRRIVVCKFANGTISKDCDPVLRPINSISCALEPCPTKATFVPVTYSSNLPIDDLVPHENDVDSHRITFRSGYTWSIDGFDECSKSCGGGVAKQILQCISVESGKIAPNDDYCDAKKKPPHTVACNQHQCPEWTTSPWSHCDVKCGDGYQHRQVLCQDLRSEILNDSDCSEKMRPRHAKKCSREPCTPNNSIYNTQRNVVSYKWRTGVWGDCSASCGPGIRRREVTCHRVNTFGWTDPSPTSFGCSLRDKPSNEQACKIRGCSDQFYWETGDWRKCSQPCGRKGRQMRRLFCLDRQGHKVRRRQCSAQLRPQRKRKCNQRPCTGPTSCAEVQTRLRTNVDDEYTLLVAGRYMSLYCHGMDGLQPKEYLTLPTGERENYAEVYDKRLRDPHICPSDGRRNDSCDCTNGTESISGRTVFKKVRINVHTLHIIGDDFTFATKVGANNIEFGRAGDCYSKLDCPQGRFGVNLSGTYLMLAPEVHWPKQMNAYSVINKINNQKVVGKCGGYCGFCAPSPGLKLNVLPP